MVFASMTFLWIFLPATLAAYYGLAKWGKQESKNLLLLFVSILFYTFGEPKYVVLLVLSAAINYGGGLAIFRTEEKWKKAALWLTVAANLLLLGYFKYYHFLADTVNSLTGGESFPIKNIVLPVGISFYTFQAMSYVIDLYRGNCHVQKNFLRLLLYITFFPQLIAGPIVRYRDIEEQIGSRKESLDKWEEGLVRFISGLGKKVILANTFAQAADRVFSLSYGDLGTVIAWFGVLLYGLQIYYDFSGYSDMAIGLGKLFGFDFLENFCLPYVSGSIQEFWRRWHISLSTWFKEYLYIPLGGNRKGQLRTCVNLLLVFLATGIWHGAGWNFVIWGLLHGVFLVLERGPWGRVLEKNPIKFLNHVYCLLVVGIGWVFFRCETMGEAWKYLSAMFSWHPEGTYGFFELFSRECLFLFVVGIPFAGLLPKKAQIGVSKIIGYRGIFLPLVLFVSVVLLAAGSYNPFIYFRF
ncbi:MBOAT family protein [Lachnospiraceae bacterium 62-35]